MRLNKENIFSNQWAFYFKYNLYALLLKTFIEYFYIFLINCIDLKKLSRGGEKSG